MLGIWWESHGLTREEKYAGAKFKMCGSGVWATFYNPDLLEFRDDPGRWVLRVRQVPRFRGVGGLRELFTQRSFLMALRKVQDAAKGAPGGAAGDPGDVALYSELWSYLSATSYPDGSPRVPSVIVIVAEAGGWKACLSDKDNQRVLWKAGATLDDVFQSIEVALQGDDPRDWRRAAQEVKKRR